MKWEELQQIIDRVHWLGGDVDVAFPQHLKQGIVIICWGLPMKKIRKTGIFSEALIEASDEFFHRVEMETREVEEDSHAA